MHILVLNWGSSSVKCSLYAFTFLPDACIDPVWHTQITWKNQTTPDCSSLYSYITETAIDCIGHRIVHGGKKYMQTARIDAELKKEIQTLAHLAPLHHQNSLHGIEDLERLFPTIPQMAVFDTAFHHTLERCAAVYPGPYAWLQEGIQRYGFHGISFQYCSKRAQQMLEQMPLRMIICHLGSGASLCALKNGKSIDTTMGFTPLEGLMMNTRSGTIDPAILLYLLKDKQRTVETLSKELYEQSGLLGISGISSDMRDILENASLGHERAQLALDIYLHRLTSAIGAMIASLQGLDCLVFTAGIGENAPLIRSEVCQRLAFLGLNIGEDSPQDDRIISCAHSRVKVLVIHTQEAFEIARECYTQVN